MVAKTINLKKKINLQWNIFYFFYKNHIPTPIFVSCVREGKDRTKIWYFFFDIPWVCYDTFCTFDHHYFSNYFFCSTQRAATTKIYTQKLEPSYQNNVLRHNMHTFITRNHYVPQYTHNAWEYSQQTPKTYRKFENESFSDFGIRLLSPLGNIDFKILKQMIYFNSHEF